MATGKYRLGLDLGTNSIGWAAVSLDDKGEPSGVLDMGVRIFPDGRDAQSKTSNAMDRRVARSARRRRDRYLKRRSDLLEALIELGLMPDDESERNKLELLDPYELRAKSLDEPLSPYEMGRVLFHLNQRRGFKSSRKADGDESEKTKISGRIDELRRQMQVAEVRTLGEFLAQRHDQKETVRARPELGLYPDRAMYLDEFDKIRESQELNHALTPGQWDRLRDEIMFFQRPLKEVLPGWCQFEDGERRAAKALPVFQEFRILQEVNNLKVRFGSEPERPLDPVERQLVLNRLRSGKDMDFNKLTGELRKLLSGADFNLALGGRNKLKGDETTNRLAVEGRPAKSGKPPIAGLFGRDWLDLPLEKRNEIVSFLLKTDDPEAVRTRATQEWGLNEGQAKAVASVSLVSGYGSLSEKAIKKILPHLERGVRYDEAVTEVYGHHSDFRNPEAHDSLPYYGEALSRDAIGANHEKDPDVDGEPARYGRFPNPTVHIGLGQLRRVVNGLIQVYGKPEDIVVELARDLKSNREQRQKYESEQRKGREANERFRKWLEDAEQPVTADILRKLRLWEEQGPPRARVCPYTGQPLSFEMVVSNQTEIDHILPFSKTLDNSISNMVVCVAAANRAKGDRSPHEAFGHSPEGYDYQEILARTADWRDNKRWRFQPEAMKEFEEEDRFLDRQLNETRYLSRTAKNYLAYLYDETTEDESTGRKQRVRAIPGRMTALLRWGWRLEGILREDGQKGKQRDDHRHHAVDAFVVACTTQGLLQRFANAAGSAYDTEEKLAKVVGSVPPWDQFDRNDLKPHLDSMIVSYKPDHGTRRAPSRTTGQLHNETAYGLVKLSERGPSEVVTRKKVADFKKRDELKAVRDPVMGKALMALWDKVESGGGKAANFAERAANEGVLMEDGRRQTVRRVRVIDKQTVIPVKHPEGHPDAGEPYKGYLPGGNEFADIWRMPDGSWRMVVVPRFEANQPDFNLEYSRPHPAARRLMRLHIDDMGALGLGKDRRIVRVRKMSNSQNGALVWLDDHNETNVDARIRNKELQEKKYSSRQLRQLGFRKVGVDEIGRVRDPGPRSQ